MFKMPKWVASNPLGIIALFISLIYAMSALLLGMSVGKLEKTNETVLVWFLALFPCAILGVFGWLVSRHHEKLYGPGDYKDDNTFEKICGLKNPKELGAKFKDEIDEEQRVKEVEKPNSFSNSGLKSTKSDVTGNADNRLQEISKRADRNVMRAYMAEGLVFQELQDNFGGTIRRQAAFRSKNIGTFNVDGVIFKDKDCILVEVKYTQSAARLSKALDEAYQRLRLYRDNLTGEHYKFLAAIVLDSEESYPEDFLEMIEDVRDDYGFDVKLYRMSELLDKYGFLVED